MFEHYPTYKIVTSFICSIRNEKGLLVKIAHKSQAYNYMAGDGIFGCLHTLEFGICAFKSCMKYLSVVQMAVLSYYRIPTVIQGLN